MLKVHQPGDDNPHLEEGGYKVPLTLVPLRPLARQVPPGSDGGAPATAGGRGDKDGAPPPATAAAVLGYNSADGNVYLLPPDAGGRGDGSDGADGSDGGAAASHATVLRRYDDAVTALAVSPDGLRVSLGFEDGSTVVYSYDGFDPRRSDKEGGPSDDGIMDSDDEGAPGPPNGNDGAASTTAAPVHPFVLCSRDAVPSFSQSQSFDNAAGEVKFDGPRMDAAVRDMAFDPRALAASASESRASSPGGKNKKTRYFLAIASESGNQPLTVVDVSDEEAAGDAHLQDRSGDEYEGGGAKSVAYTSLPPSESDEAGISGCSVVLSCVGMSGRLTHWDVTSASDPELMWDLVHGEYAAVAAQDDGLGAGGSGSVLAARGAWVTLLPREEETVPGEDEKARVPRGVMLVPGKADLQYRVTDLASDDGGELTADELKKCLSKAHFASGGHVDDIVAIIARNKSIDEAEALTGGADGRVCRWTLTIDSEGNVECAYGGEAKVPPAEEGTGVPPITSLVWSGESGVLVGRGDGSVVAADVGRTSGSGGGGKTADAAEEAAAEDAEEASASDDDDRTLPAPVDEGEEEADDGGSAEKNKKKKAKVAKLIDDEAEDGSDGEDGEVQYDDVIAVEKPTEADGTAADGTGGADETGGADDDNMDFDAGDHFDDPAEDLPSSTFAPSLPPNQPPFAPSSTPADEPRRILCWNHVGVATLRPDDGDDPSNTNNVVDIGFHETAGLVGGRRPVTFTDNVGFVLGTLGEEGGVFATDPVEDVDGGDDEDEDDLDALGIMSEEARRAARRSTRRKRGGGGGGGTGGSSVYYHRFETFGSARDKDWVAGLPDGEGAVGVAAGKGWVGVVTSRRFLRLFTAGGVQGPVLWLPGPPVAVVGREGLCAVFHHRSSSAESDGTQLLGYAVYDGRDGSVVGSGNVSSLSPGSSLSWAGFNEKSALCVMDSEGMVSMLSLPAPSSSTAGAWMPVLDTAGHRRTSTDSHWPVELHGARFVCVLLRGGKTHPDAGRRPVTTSLGLRLPMATGMSYKSSNLEELTLRSAMALDQQKARDDRLVALGEADADDAEEDYDASAQVVDKVTLRLFTEVAKAGKVERALDVARRLHLERSLDLAVRVADRVGQQRLADRIEDVRSGRFPPPADDDGEEDDGGSFGGDAGDDGEYEERITSRAQLMERNNSRVSPEGGRLSTPTKDRGPADDGSDGEEYDGRPDAEEEESPPPAASRKRGLPGGAPATLVTAGKRRRANPFAKKRLESPARGLVAPKSPARVSLSRQSTFSARSRQKMRKGKQIV